MESVPIGAGQAGHKLVHARPGFGGRNGFDAVVGALGVNSARSDLQFLPLDTVLTGEIEMNGHGTGGDSELGTAAMRDDHGTVLGGTGSEGAPSFVGLERVSHRPVYAVGILPGRNGGASAGRTPNDRCGRCSGEPTRRSPGGGC